MKIKIVHQCGNKLLKFKIKAHSAIQESLTLFYKIIKEQKLCKHILPLKNVQILIMKKLIK